MKHLTIIIAFIAFSTVANAQLLGTFTTQAEGGIKGTGATFTPTIELYLPASDKQTNTLIFDQLSIGAGEEVSFTLTNNSDDSEFENFVTAITTSSEYLLKVGHVINGIKSNSASSIESWFGEDADFVAEEISSITITFKNVTFENDTENNWTDFSYEMSLSINSNDNTVSGLGEK